MKRKTFKIGESNSCRQKEIFNIIRQTFSKQIITLLLHIRRIARIKETRDFISENSIF